jgi:lipopolysaccharide/colanic/teichoic acid biosynthesis glycosyltransferase
LLSKSDFHALKLLIRGLSRLTLFSVFQAQQPTQQGVRLIVTPGLEQDSFSNVGRSTSKQSMKSPVPEGHLESTFWPRHVSDWCLSKRKRAFDLAFSVVALILFSPLMILIGWLVRMTSEGPALFRQERVGLDQRSFVILKFRTMRHCGEQEDKGSQVTKHDDPRTTKTGALLRRFKLDELPQLINVVRGEMSFVGPRPKIPQHEHLRMLCRPGITGAATIVFSHEESLLENVPEVFVEHYVTSVLNPEKCRLDCHYIETAKFGTDLRILVRTVFKLSNRPARVWITQPMLVKEKPPIERLPSVSRNRILSEEFSAQEIGRSA